MTARFVACVACGRHVKEGDAACPFCGKGAPDLEPLPRLSRVRLTRAAMIAAGTAGTVAAVLDCGQSSSSTTIFYGVACTGSECVPGGEDAAAALNDGGSSEDAAYLYDGGSSVNFYGVPCTGDACVPHIHGDAASPDANAADATSASDAGDE